ncbi:CDP-alcohol phosphatidyltransferase family protein [Jiangella gansuensis]|uniref:CDP-alcohol phosphatidyltransferase family protein n=1 Tax=Jiangella gansuensis TaxID=281473 RepID=UPI00047D5A6B|nr:CDP-alcohol phosphatidyltransferase family protein [Jiangella gansuensis]
MEVQETSVQTDRVFTVPNVLSFLRLLGVPVFLWLVLVEEADTVAIILLAVSGFTDYLDGWLARRWNQISRVGQLLDPLADRLYILTTIVALTLRDIIPLWFAVLLVARDVYMAVIVALLKARRGLTGLPVHFLGKSATACLLYAFPLLLWGDADGTLAMLARVFGWAFVLWGVALYWWAAVLYTFQARRVLSGAAAKAG